MTGTTGFFEVDKRGLAQILERRGKAFVVTELYQNAMDENVSRIGIQLLPAGRGLTRITVDDDSPDGWKDLRDAWTLFAPSYKKADPTKAGRFNLGEKLVLAVAREAEIITMNGSVRFGPEGRTVSDAMPTRQGSIFTAVIQMTVPEREEAERLVRGLLVPDHIELTMNGERIPSRIPVVSFEASLETERADADGNLRPATRKTVVNLYDPLPGEKGTLFELGIPVVQTGDRWHVSVEQKVPVSLDRTGLVTPGYLRDVRAEVLNQTAELLDHEDSTERWVSAALEDERTSDDAVETVVTARYGDQRVIYDPSDKEANRIATAEGYTVIHGGAFSAKAWERVRETGAALPAGKVTPSPKPEEHMTEEADKTVPNEDYPELVAYMIRFGESTLGYTPAVRLVNDPQWGFRATFGARRITWNLASAPHTPATRECDDLLIHEYAHEYGSHLSHGFDHGLSKVGAAAVAAARTGALDGFIDGPLAAIHKLMDGTEWDAGTLEAIRDVLVIQAGLTIREPDEVPA